ncbi:MAG TPA: 16S rRNA (guanine(966)-N(2))-methyltransferase RsmD [Vicinamibacterales bacterium]|nr:16S rRNA (guanine(966)-N(2))-methyltransferase RsmD [Vicinamibacterales bacterium]
MPTFGLRVIAGTLKGRRLKVPDWDGLRPTADKLRETLFNVLAPRIAGARVLDGYAGTGALGIEALSRGASDVTFVESDPRAQALVLENLAHCGIASGYAMIRATVARSMETLRAAPAFDIILLDPPYSQQPDDVVTSVGELVAPLGVVVLEHARRQAAAESLGSLTRTRQIVSGDSALSFYEPTNR